MNSRTKIDRESFQTFLSNAFAVQESALEPHSLSALIKVQRFIAGNELNLDAAMHLIADCALSVSSASGVAVALVEADELVYRAGSGSAEKHVGRRVPAVLIASSKCGIRPEILRVENAETDMRIEAEVCRQFGTSSLLMLPIRQKNALAGTLQVWFNDAHSFLDGEVRTYRLMVEILEEAMLRGVQSAQKRPVCSVGQVADGQSSSPKCPQSVENAAMAGGQNTAQAHRARPRPGCSEEPRASVFRGYQATIIREMTAVRKALMIVIQTLEARAGNATIRKVVPPIGAVILVSIAVWISYVNHHVETKSGLPSLSWHGPQPQAPSKPLSVSVDPKRHSDGSNRTMGLRHGFRRVRVGANEVDYIAADVTIRQFEIQHSTPQLRSDLKEVNFGDDVTVRYFANRPLDARTTKLATTQANRNP